MTKLILIEARRLIVEEGWTQGVYTREVQVGPERSRMCYCLSGALMEAAETYWLRREIALQYWRTLMVMFEGRLLYLYGIGPVTFNDTPGRSRQEIVDLIDAILAVMAA